MRTTLKMPETTLPATIDLRIGTTTNGATGKSIGTLLTTGSTLKLDKAEVTRQQTILFGEEIQLIGYELSENIGQADTFVVDLFWEAIDQPSADYTVFVHLLDENGVVVSQYDRGVGGTIFPSSTWQMGDYYQDSFPLLLPDSAESGTYQLATGMYQWPSLDPILITDASGDLVETVTLSEVEIDRR